jgi:hypothetical protein
VSAQIPTQTKAVVTVAEMARMVGLSRARFYQLIGSAFPSPDRDADTGRPYYVEDAQKVCLEVRRRNCGVDGKPILFYARRGGAPTAQAKRRESKPQDKVKNKYIGIVDAMKGLGLAGVTEQQVSATVTMLFPKGIAQLDQAEVIRSVFVHIQRQNSTDKLGR